MTGQQILEQTSTARRWTPGSTEPELVQEPVIPESQRGVVDQAVLDQWTQDAAAYDADARRRIALPLRQALMAGRTGGSPSLATTAALIDMLEA